MLNLLNEIEEKLIDINNENNFNFENIGIIGGRAGSGKSWYAIKKAIEAMQRNESVLIFNTEETKNELSKRFVKMLSDKEMFLKVIGIETKTHDEKSKEIEKFLNEAKIQIMNSEFEEKLLIDKMKELSNSKDGLDLVIVDTLPTFANKAELLAKISKLEGLAGELGCKIITLTQLNANANISRLNTIK